MSQKQQQLTDGVKAEDEVLVEDGGKAGQETAGMVPVAEAIKYRKRAQAAEQQVEELSDELNKRKESEVQAQEKLREVNRKNELAKHFHNAGVKDFEVARLLVEKAMESSPDGKLDIPEAIEQVRQERPYLFTRLDEPGLGLGLPTAGVTRKKNGGKAMLHQQALKASQSGSRKDVQDYLRMRRSMR